MSKRGIEIALAVGVLGIGLVLAVVLGLHAYMSATATPLHPEPDAAPSVVDFSPAGDWTSAVDRGRDIVRSALASQNLPGISIAVGTGSDIVWAEGFGFADLEKREPVTPSHLFRIGTASTILTSAAVGLLVEKNRLQLDEEIQTYVPEFPKKEWPVTLRQLMGHVAGVRNDGGDEGPFFSRHCERPVDALEVFADRSLLFEPGTRSRYSSYGWILVSAAVEAAANDRFDSFMRKEVFEPLGMLDTIPDSATEPVPNRATPYFPRYAADPRYGLHLMRDIDLSCYSGASMFLSTSSDLVRFGLGLSAGKLLQPATVRLLETPLQLPSGEETEYGLGWRVRTATLAGEEARVVGHDGAVLGGTVGSLVIFPERELAVAVLSNISYADTYSLAVSIAEEFARVAQAVRPARRP